MTLTRHTMDEKGTPLRLLDLCRPLCVDGLPVFVERKRTVPLIKPVKQGWQMCPLHPQVALQYLKRRPTENSPAPPAGRTQSSSRVRPYHSQILPRDSWVSCLMGSWLKVPDRAYLVSVSCYYVGALVVEHTQNIRDWVSCAMYQARVF